MTAAPPENMVLLFVGVFIISRLAFYAEKKFGVC
jgi:hypothetical protein